MPRQNYAHVKNSLIAFSWLIQTLIGTKLSLDKKLNHFSDLQGEAKEGLINRLKIKK
jgi:hypothetical protein